MKNLQSELLIGALENARFGVCVVDESGRLVLTNDAFVKKLGLNAANVLGQSYLCLFNLLGAHPSFHKLFSAREAELSIELPIVRADGEHVCILLQSSVMNHSSGEAFRVVSLMDVTDYGVTRDRFTELHRQMEAVNNAVVIVDARAPDMPITYVNAHFERMTGYPKNEVIGRNCRFLQESALHGSARDQEALVVLRAALQKRESCHVTLRNFRKDGSEFSNELFVSPVFDDASELTHFIGVQHEASARNFIGAFIK